MVCPLRTATREHDSPRRARADPLPRSAGRLLVARTPGTIDWFRSLDRKPSLLISLPRSARTIRCSAGSCEYAEEVTQNRCPSSLQVSTFELRLRHDPHHARDRRRPRYERAHRLRADRRYGHLRTRRGSSCSCMSRSDKSGYVRLVTTPVRQPGRPVLGDQLGSRRRGVRLWRAAKVAVIRSASTRAPALRSWTRRRLMGSRPSASTSSTRVA